MAGFVHLHTHSEFSLLDGACSLSQLIGAAVKHDMAALALTDHGNLFGAVDFYLQAREQGIKPIIGCEMYVAPGSRKTKRKNAEGVTAFHLPLLAKNLTGYRHLIELVSAGFLEGFYYHPRIDRELLRTHHEGLIALSGCLKGEVSFYLARNEYERARDAARFYRELLGDDFFLEVQDAGIPAQKEVNQGMTQLGKELSLPLVATNDVHYITPEDARAQEVLICVQTGKNLSDSGRLKFSTNQLYFRGPREMQELFQEVPGAVETTEEIASRCSLLLPMGQVHLPVFHPPDGSDRERYLRALCERGLSERYVEVTPEIRQRLDDELAVILKKGFADYFLIVQDFIQYAQHHGILVGPGRGSAAGCLVAYLIGITQIDPLRYGLLFERFLNAERTAMPDIDIDIQDERRDEVIRYVRDKYGEQSVAQIITFGTMAARAAIRDVGRVLGLPYGKVDQIAKLIPFNTSLAKARNEVPEIKEMIEEDEETGNLFEVAQRIEGLTRHASTHAAGVVIAPDRLTKFTPLYRTNRNEVTTQYPMGALESIGLLKMDFLGLKTLNVIHHTLEAIRRTRNETVDLARIGLEDDRTYELLSAGETAGVFQVESSGMQDLLKRLGPERFEDVIALLALYRPGPLNSHMVDDYVDGKWGRATAKYLHPSLEPILKETYGVILYQEQVMRIANVLAGFSLGEADVLRRAMGKKKRALMDKQRVKFVEGAVNRDVKKETAEKVFDLIAYFAGYGFNKSHSAGYALICYQTAYLKANYPVEFMAALLTSERENTDKLVEYIGECRRMGIRIQPPDINASGVDFTVEKDAIRFGLSAIKNVGQGVARSVVDEQKKGEPYASIYDFCRRVDLRAVNRRVMESLIRCGALDCLPGNRSQKLAVMEDAAQASLQIHQDRERGQLSLLDDLTETAEAPTEERLPDIEEVPRMTSLSWEKELLGTYLSGHPLEKYAQRLRSFTSHSLARINEAEDRERVRVGGIVSGVETKRDKKGRSMAFVTLEDLVGDVEVVVFSSIFEKSSEQLKEGEVVVISGRIDSSRDSAKVIADEVASFASLQRRAQNLHIRIAVDQTDIDLERLREVLLAHQGKTPVFLHLDAGGHPVVMRSRSIKVRFSEALARELEHMVRKDAVWLSEN